MGISKSREMARANETRAADDLSGSEEGSDSESDLASILQYLIRSGQVRILGREQPYLGAYPKPPIAGAPNLDNFHKSEICFLTKKSCGMVPRGPKSIAKTKRPNKSITEMITSRESGQLKGGMGFSQSEKCVIGNSKLPIKMKVVDTYENKAFCGIYSHDGNTLLTASQDRFMRTYDSSNGHTFKDLQIIQGRDIGWSVLDTTFSPDSSKIAYSSWSTSLHMVDVETGDSGRHVSLPLSPQERRFCVFSLVFSHSGDEILCGANDGHLYIYDLAKNERSLRIDAHDDDVNTVAFADITSQIIYSGGDDGFCKVWDRRTLSEGYPAPVGILAGHLDGVTYIDSRNDGRHFISNSKDQSIKLWDIRVMSSLAAQENTRKAVNSNKWDYRWQTAPRKLITRKTNIKGDTSIATYRGHSVLQTLIRCHFSPQFSTGQRYIVTGCAFGRVVVYDILTGQTVLKLQGHSSCVRDVSWHPYRPEIISSSWDFSVLCWTHFGMSLDTGTKSTTAWEEEEEEEGGGGGGGGGVGGGGGGGGEAGEAGGDEWNSTQRLRRSRRIADKARAQ